MSDLETRIARIEERNERVEFDKAWEVSWVRRVLITLITYVFVGLYLTWLDVDRAWLNAIVPVAGFLFSTLALTAIKHRWVAKRAQSRS